MEIPATTKRGTVFWKLWTWYVPPGEVEAKALPAKGYFRVTPLKNIITITGENPNIGLNINVERAHFDDGGYAAIQLPAGIVYEITPIVKVADRHGFYTDVTGEAARPFKVSLAPGDIVDLESVRSYGDQVITPPSLPGAGSYVGETLQWDGSNWNHLALDETGGAMVIDQNSFYIDS